MAKSPGGNRISLKETLDLIRQLRPFGFKDEDFELFHPWGSPKGNLKDFANNINKKTGERLFQFDHSNHRTHKRLQYALDHIQEGKSFAELAKEAFVKFPPV